MVNFLTAEYQVGVEAKTVLVGVEGEGMVAVAVEAKRKQSLDSVKLRYNYYVAIATGIVNWVSPEIPLLQLMP